MRIILITIVMTAVLSSFSVLRGQDSASGETSAAMQSGEPTEAIADTATDIVEDKLTDKLEGVAETVNENEQAQQAATGILSPIYEAAEYLSFSAFHWLAFAMMVAGLISFGLQLVLGKLIMLLQFHFSLTEILADGLGFAISAIGLILTTQAATENSSFTSSPALVLSATAVGVLFGLVFYVRGQTQEFREARELRRRKK